MLDSSDSWSKVPWINKSSDWFCGSEYLKSEKIVRWFWEYLTGGFQRTRERGELDLGSQSNWGFDQLLASNGYFLTVTSVIVRDRIPLGAVKSMRQYPDADQGNRGCLVDNHLQ